MQSRQNIKQDEITYRSNSKGNTLRNGIIKLSVAALKLWA